MINIKEIPSFQTLSGISRMIDLYGINSELTSIYSTEHIAAMAPFMVHTCKYTTATRRILYNNCKDYGVGWSKTTKGWSYKSLYKEMNLH